MLLPLKLYAAVTQACLNAAEGASADAAARFSAFGGPSRGAFTFFLAFAGTSAGIAAALRVRCGWLRGRRRGHDARSSRETRVRRGV